MKKSFIFSVIILGLCAALLSGCVTLPKTPEELRKFGARKSLSYSTKTYTVERSFSDVSKALQRYVPKCMYVEVNDTIYTPILKVTKKRAVLHVQADRTSLFLDKSKLPEKGYYYLVAEVILVDKKTTRIEIYYARPNDMVDAVKGWASGKIVGCPSFF